MHRTMIAVLLLSWAMPAHAAEQLIPLAEGYKWVYSVTENGVMSFELGSGNRSTQTTGKGTSTDTVRLARGEGPNGGDAYLLTTTRKMEAGLNTKAKDAVADSLLVVTDSGIEMTASRSSGLQGTLSGKWERYAPPLLMYRGDAKPGATWDIGAMREGEMIIPLQANVIRRENVIVPAGEFKDCLKICVSSKQITGTMTIGKLTIPITDGKQLTMVWIAKGVGIVKEDSLMQITIDLPGSEGGSPIAATSTQRRIKELQPGYKVK